MTVQAARLNQHNSPGARERLILDHLPQVRYVARRLAVRLPAGVQVDDLVSAGILGLFDAVDKFDAAKGVRFRTYAEVRIKGAMLDSLRDLDWAPRALRRRARLVETAYARLEQRLGRSASDSEIAHELGISLPDFHELLNQLQSLQIGHFQASHDHGDAVRLQDELPCQPASSETSSPFSACLRGEIRTLLAQAIERLPEREQLVLSLYYYDELTMREIGQVLGVNESRVCQLHTRAILRLRGKLRHKLAGQLGD